MGRGERGGLAVESEGCLKAFSRVGQRCAGGWTTWGSHERIVIALAYSDEGGEVEGSNVTVA